MGKIFLCLPRNRKDFVMKNKSKIIRKRLTDNELIIEIKKLWGKGERGKVNLYELLRTKFTLGKSRALKTYDVVEAEMIKITQAAQDAAIAYEQKAALQDELKTDLELEMVLCQIAIGNLTIEEWVRGNPILRNVSPMEQIAAIDKIYKKRGSYAPIKQEHSGSVDFGTFLTKASVKK